MMNKSPKPSTLSNVCEEFNGSDNSSSQYNEDTLYKPKTKVELYKTELCKSYEETGYCKYGDKCQFAHGVGELRPVARNPKYKTKVCQSYWTTGTCKYGKRCNFIHILPSEVNSSNIDQLGNVSKLPGFSELIKLDKDESNESHSNNSSDLSDSDKTNESDDVNEASDENMSSNTLLPDFNDENEDSLPIFEQLTHDN